MVDTRLEINMIGGGMQHSPSSSGFDPLYVKWIKGNHTAKVSFYIDYHIRTNPNPLTINYAFLHESKDINKGLYEWCADNINFLEKAYKRVFTHDISLLPLSNIFCLYKSGKSFISEKDAKIYPKTKLISIVASNKLLCPAHYYRAEIVQKFKDKCDLYGRGYNPIDDKLDALKDYCFSIAMENGNYPNMVSEKISDCFMAGTIPVFYGIDNIGDFYNEEGIIKLDKNFKIEDLSFDLYNSKIKAVKDNFNRAVNQLVIEDYIYVTYLKNDLQHNS